MLRLPRNGLLMVNLAQAGGDVQVEDVNEQERGRIWPDGTSTQQVSWTWDVGVLVAWALVAEEHKSQGCGQPLSHRYASQNGGFDSPTSSVR